MTRVRGSSARNFPAFECGGDGCRAGTRGQEGRYKLFLMLGGGGGRTGLSAWSGMDMIRETLDMIHWSHYTFIPHKGLPPCQPFYGLQDAHSISLALNNCCPLCHIHSWNNETVIPLNGITINTLVMWARMATVSKRGKQKLFFNIKAKRTH
jgi:hypothetical protein